MVPSKTFSETVSVFITNETSEGDTLVAKYRTYPDRKPDLWLEVEATELVSVPDGMGNLEKKVVKTFKTLDLTEYLPDTLVEKDENGREVLENRWGTNDWAFFVQNYPLLTIKTFCSSARRILQAARVS